MTPPNDSLEHPTIICTVDVVLLTLRQERLQVALLQRAQAPHEGEWALPGGYVHAQIDRNADDAVRRVLASKLGITGVYCEQLATFSGALRDPRGWSIAVAHCAFMPAQAMPEHGPAGEIRWVDAAALPPLPFDHADIVATALARVRSKAQYSSLPVHLCGESFTLPQLQKVYEAILGEPLNKVSFRRKMDELGVLEPIEGALLKGAANRPSQLWRVRAPYRQQLAVISRGL